MTIAELRRNVHLQIGRIAQLPSDKRLTARALRGERFDGWKSSCVCRQSQSDSLHVNAGHCTCFRCHSGGALVSTDITAARNRAQLHQSQNSIDRNAHRRCGARFQQYAHRDRGTAEILVPIFTTARPSGRGEADPIGRRTAAPELIQHCSPCPQAAAAARNVDINGSIFDISKLLEGGGDAREQIEIESNCNVACRRRWSTPPTLANG